MTDCASIETQYVNVALKQLESRFHVAENVQRINLDELSVLSVLGKGGFSVVLKVVHVQKGGSQDDESDNNSSSSVSLHQQDGCYHACKHLNIRNYETDEDFVAGVHDLLCEATTLSQLNHKNIIKLNGVSSQSPSQAYHNNIQGFGYFILLDILQETLDDRLNRWRHADEVPRHNIFGTNQDRRQMEILNLLKRNEGVAIGLCHAMQYLHEKKIVYHDIKPNNIGFDESGTVKLFDFGLARHIDNDIETGEIVGTFRYMAPEIMTGVKGGLPSDVYSFGILLWELFTLRIPFDHMKASNREEFIHKVGKRHRRPILNAIPDKATRRLIQQCWDPCQAKRPTFDEINMSLSDLSITLKKKQIGKCQDESSKHPLSRIRRKCSISNPRRSSSLKKLDKCSFKSTAQSSSTSSQCTTNRKVRSQSLILPKNMRLSFLNSESLRNLVSLVKRSDDSDNMSIDSSELFDAYDDV